MYSSFAAAARVIGLLYVRAPALVNGGAIFRPFAFFEVPVAGFGVDDWIGHLLLFSLNSADKTLIAEKWIVYVLTVVDSIQEN